MCIVGDFNIPNVDWFSSTASDTLGDYLLSAVNELRLFQMVTEPTREANYLDLVFCNNHDFVVD